jgi:hypothetical protein
MSDLIERAKQVGFHRAALEAGAMISDGPVPEDFAAAWGTAGLSIARVAHYWTAERPEWRNPDVLYGLRSACGLQSIGTRRVPLRAAGNFPYCARCEKALMRKAGK